MYRQIILYRWNGRAHDDAARRPWLGDVFRIPGRGTVVTGLLQGNFPLDVGVLLRGGPPGDVLRGRTVTFEPGTAAGSPPSGMRPGKRRWRR